MDMATRLALLICLMGGFALAMPWLAWVRLRRLHARHGAKLLVRGVTGAQAARVVLLRGNIEQVDVDETSVAVTDFYSAFEPAIKLSPESYHGRRLFDVARAGRLAGHALQHRDRKLGNLASWDACMILWGNVWPVLFLITLFTKGRGLWALAGLSILAGIMTAVHLIKHAHVKDAARRGRRELEGAHLLDGHPEAEVDAAFLAARMEHLALPYSRTWWRLLFAR